MGLALSAAIVTVAVVRLGRGQQVSQPWKEFSVRRVERSTTLINGLSHERTVLEAQRADGSRVLADVADGGRATAFSTRVITLVPSRRTIFVDDRLAATTTHFDLSQRAYRPTTDPQCGFTRLTQKAKPRVKGEEDVLGFRTVVIQTESGPFLTTDWKAPDLGCATLRMTEERRDGPRGDATARFELSAVSVTVGSPDPALFEVPASYTEGSPSQLANASAARMGRAVPERALKRLAERDQRYFENHRQAGVP
ncbi:MAG TPA: hypothetical protein VEU62_24005 [Bryobacterales bacterium]|nr:hypothetical protein [Bryobacterales bacterium]